MPKKITFYVQRYRPAFEAISKEVALLKENLGKTYSTRIHDLHLDGLFLFQNNKEIASFHFLYYPLLFPYTYFLNRKSDLNHIYTSLGDLPYLPLLDPQKTILTAAASCSISKIKRRKRFLSQLRAIIVESEKQRQELLTLGIEASKIHLIYPPINEAQFSYVPAPEDIRKNCRLLYASCPTRAGDFQKRGINLLAEYATTNFTNHNREQKQSQVQFALLWRGGAYPEILSLLKQKNISPAKVNIKNEIITNMNAEYASVHATIIPYTIYDDFLKLMPNSALESLAAGKPVLASSKTEIAKFIQKHSCGVVFEPTPEGLHRAILDLQNNYSKYQKNCLAVALKYFSKKRFVDRYQEIYHQVFAKTP